MQTPLYQRLYAKIKSEFSIKNNWDLSSEIDLLLDFKASNDANFSLLYSWIKNYCKAVDLPFSLFIQTLKEENILEWDKMELNQSEFPLKIKYPNHAVELVTELHIQLFQSIETHSKPEFKSYVFNDAEKHIQFLEQSIQTDSIILFNEYIAWANTMLNALNISTETLIRFLVSIRMVYDCNGLSKEVEYLDGGIQLLIGGNVTSATSEYSFTITDESKKYLELLLSKERNTAKNFILELADSGMDIRAIFLDIFQASQYELGRLWELNKITIAQEHYCTAATQTFMAMLTARIVPAKMNGKKVIATCVGTEQHEMGIRIVNDFLEMEGWDAYYLGANVPLEAIILSIKDHQPDLLALSVTLTPHVKQVIEIIKQVKNIFPSIKILVGGYPFLRDNRLANKIGADGIALDAKKAPAIAWELVTKIG